MFGRNCLLLNADAQPLSIVPLSMIDWKDAVKMIWEETAYAVEEYDNAAHSPSITIQLPAVLMLKEYKKQSRTIRFSKANVFLRDLYICQYCELDMKNDQHLCTLEHVWPRSRGGKTVWDNTSTACPDCNTTKANEVDMKPKNKPFKPTLAQLINNKRSMPLIVDHPAWQDYLQWDPNLLVYKP